MMQGSVLGEQLSDSCAKEAAERWATLCPALPLPQVRAGRVREFVGGSRQEGAAVAASCDRAHDRFLSASFLQQAFAKLHEFVQLVCEC